jgi:hypothetical protein
VFFDCSLRPMAFVMIVASVAANLLAQRLRARS